MAEFNKEEFCLKLKKARKDCGLTQENLAHTLKVNPATISRFENGDIIPNVEQITKICKELNIYVSELLDLSDKIINRENSKNPFNTDKLYLYYKGVLPTTKKITKLKFILQIVEHFERVEVNLLDYKTEKIYMTGYLLSDNSTAIMIFENYKPNNPKLEMGKLVVNIANNINSLMMGALSATNNKNIPNERKCIVSKQDLEFTKDMLEMLKITDDEIAEIKEQDAWYMNINNKDDYEN